MNFTTDHEKKLLALDFHPETVLVKISTVKDLGLALKTRDADKVQGGHSTLAQNLGLQNHTPERKGVVDTGLHVLDNENGVSLRQLVLDIFRLGLTYAGGHKFVKNVPAKHGKPAKQRTVNVLEFSRLDGASGVRQIKDLPSPIRGILTEGTFDGLHVWINLDARDTRIDTVNVSERRDVGSPKKALRLDLEFEPQYDFDKVGDNNFDSGELIE